MLFDSLELIKSTCYDFTNILCHAFNPKSPVDSDSNRNHATCSASHSHTSDSITFDHLTLLKVMKMVRIIVRL